MKRLGRLLGCAMIGLWCASLAAQEDAPVEQRLSEQRLEELVTPLALYSDVLLSQVLNAATYPEDLAEAAAWSAAHGSRGGPGALMAVMSKPWDASVKSLVPFPKLLSSMTAHPDRTAELARAFLGDEQSVLDSIQKARRKAYAEGALKGARMERRGGDLVIDSAAGLRHLVYGGFDWRDRQTHIVSIRIDWVGHGALLGHEEEARKAPEITDADEPAEKEAPEQLAYVKPPPLVNLSPRSSEVPASAPDRTAAVQQPVNVPQAPPLVGLGGPQRRELPPVTPDDSKQAAKPDMPADASPPSPLISLMPELLAPDASERAPAPKEANTPPKQNVPSHNDQPLITLMPEVSKTQPSAAAFRPRAYRTFIGAEDRRTLESLATALRR